MPELVVADDAASLIANAGFATSVTDVIELIILCIIEFGFANALNLSKDNVKYVRIQAEAGVVDFGVRKLAMPSRVVEKSKAF